MTAIDRDSIAVIEVLHHHVQGPRHRCVSSLFFMTTTSSQVTLRDHVYVTQFMAGDVVGQGAHADAMSVGDPGP